MLKSLYLAIPLAFNPPTEGFPWDDLRNIFRGCQRMAKVPMASKHCRKFQPADRVGRTNITDDRQTDERATAYTFAKNLIV